MPVVTTSAEARSWMQAPMRAPAACTIRISIAGGGGNHDWSVTAGETWASLDDLVDDWNAALAGAATVALAPDAAVHRALMIVTTGTGAAWSITWSQSGDGTAIRDRLGAAADVSAVTSGQAGWAGLVVGAFYSWVGFGGLVQTRSEVFGGAAARMMDGTIVSHHAIDSGADLAEMDLVVRWALHPDALGLYRMSGHVALEAFLEGLYDAHSDTFAVYHDAGGASAERWLVRIQSDRIHIRPECVTMPHLAWEVALRLDVVEAPL